MACSKQRKQIASHVAMHTCNQINCVESFYTKCRSVFLKQLILYHSLLKITPSYLKICEAILDNQHMIHFISDYLKTCIIKQIPDNIINY